MTRKASVEEDRNAVCHAGCLSRSAWGHMNVLVWLVQQHCSKEPLTQDKLGVEDISAVGWDVLQVSDLRH